MFAKSLKASKFPNTKFEIFKISNPDSLGVKRLKMIFTM